MSPITERINEVKMQIDDIEDYIQNQCSGCKEAYEKLKKLQFELGLLIEEDKNGIE